MDQAHDRLENRDAAGRPEALRNIDLSEEKKEEVAARRKHRDAVWGLVKDGLAKKLLTFQIMYELVFVVLMVVMAFVRKSVPDFKNPDWFTVFFASNFIYIGCLTLLSLIYGLYREVGWLVALIVAALCAVLPSVFEWLVGLNPYVLAFLSIPVVFGVSYLATRRELWRRLKLRLEETRRVNTKGNQDRDACRKEVEGFLLRAGGGGGKRPARVNVFRRIRTAMGYDPVEVLYEALTRDGFASSKEALEDYAKRHRFKDAMGRLATVVWGVGALAYLIYPDSAWGAQAGLAALNVLPLYAALMFVMDRMDDVDEDAFKDLGRLIRPEAEPPHCTAA
jgi:hypothetical protein